MTVAEAKAVAREWAVQRSKELPDIAGAFLLGSICRRGSGEVFPHTSDIDLSMAVKGTGHDTLTELDGEYRMQSIEYKGLDIEVVYPSISELADPQAVLGNASRAPAFKTDNVLLDPSGVLGGLRDPVRAAYKQERWVRARCRSQEQFVRWALDKADRQGMRLPGWADDFLERIVWLLFPGLAGSAGIPCVADLGGPTFRKAMTNCRKVLYAYGMAEIYSELLGILGASAVTRQQAGEWIAEMQESFALAVRCMQTGFYGGFLFRAFMQRKVVDGAYELVSEGFHREAMLYVAVVRTRTQNVFENDAPLSIREAMRERHRRLMAALGIDSGADISARAEALREVLTEIMSVAETIIARNPAVEHP